MCHVVCVFAKKDIGRIFSAHNGEQGAEIRGRTRDGRTVLAGLEAGGVEAGVIEKKGVLGYNCGAVNKYGSAGSCQGGKLRPVKGEELNSMTAT